ncbi:MAG: family 10 glycosylhydrolase [Armatimonadota bacterium]
MVSRYMIVLSLLIALVAPAAANSTNAPVKPVEGRGLWVDAMSIPADDDSMAKFVESIAEANINVIFPEVIRRGYTIYPSKLDEQNEKWKGYDPLAALIREAHARGIEVHPWITCFRQGYSEDKGPILRAHPDWIAVNKWGEALSALGGYWICPSIPEARDYIAGLIKEVVSGYDVDGVHLDYIRFENQFPSPYCYNDSCRCKFKAQYGVDPIDIDPLTEMQVTWHLWREDLINTFVQRVAKESRAAKPGMKISAAVGSMPDTARESMLQNWPHWVDNKWVDFVSPMAYTGNSDTYRKMITSEKAAVDDRTLLLPGIGLHTQKTTAPTLEQIGISRDMDTDGVALFAAAHMKEDLRAALAAGPFSNKAELPFRDTAERVKTLLDSAIALYEAKPAEASSYLGDAARLLRYLAYQVTNTGYVKPTRPPIVIPETVLPLPAVDVKRAGIPPVIDGKLNDRIWTSAAKIEIAHTDMGKPAPVSTVVRLAYDDTSLYIAYSADEPMAKNIKATVTKRDGPVFYDDSLEMFIDPWNKRRDYYQLSANTLDAEFDARVNNSSINLDWQVKTAKNETGWTAEVVIPFKTFGVEPPKPGDVWNANLGRNRWVTGEPQYLIWSVPYGSFHRPERFGIIRFK